MAEILEVAMHTFVCLTAGEGKGQSGLLNNIMDWFELVETVVLSSLDSKKMMTMRNTMLMMVIEMMMKKKKKMEEEEREWMILSKKKRMECHILLDLDIVTISWE